MTITKLAKSWDGFNQKTLYRLMRINKPVVTLVMLSFRRPKLLLETLERHLENQWPINLCLRVQGAEELNDNLIDTISTLGKKFYGCHIRFTKGNYGSGEPRHDLINRALVYFNTPYIMTTDDDMYFQRNSILASISILEDREEYGAIGQWCSPKYNRWILRGDKFSCIEITGDKKFEDHVDAMGSATTVFRREVFDNCEYDKEYYIGWGDYDLCMQIRRAGWKLGILALPGLKAHNAKDKSPRSYAKVRWQKGVGIKSRDRFRTKWGVR